MTARECADRSALLFAVLVFVAAIVAAAGAALSLSLERLFPMTSDTDKPTPYHVKNPGQNRAYYTDHTAPEHARCMGCATEPINEDDVVEHPSHYVFPNGAEVIEITENLGFLEGNVVKYAARAGRKVGAAAIIDMRKAVWYGQRAIAKLERESGK